MCSSNELALKLLQMSMLTINKSVKNENAAGFLTLFHTSKGFAVSSNVTWTVL